MALRAGFVFLCAVLWVLTCSIETLAQSSKVQVRNATVELFDLAVLEGKPPSDTFQGTLDLGLVHVSQPLDLKISFVNPSKSQARISKLTTGCSCLASSADDRLWESKENVTVSVRYRPNPQFGPFKTAVQIELSNSSGNKVANVSLSLKGDVRDYIQIDNGSTVLLKVDSSMLSSTLEPINVFNYFTKSTSPPTVIDPSGNFELRSASPFPKSLPEHALSGWQIRLGLTSKFQESIAQRKERSHVNAGSITILQKDSGGVEHKRELNLWLSQKPFMRSRTDAIKLIKGMQGTNIDLFFLEEIAPELIYMKLMRSPIEVNFKVVSSTPSWIRVSVDTSNWIDSLDANGDELEIGLSNGRAKIALPVTLYQNKMP